MNRRKFLQHSGRTLAAVPILASGLVNGGCTEATAPAPAVPADVMSRIGITTVCFRERFAKTRTAGKAAPAGGDMTLLTAPKFISDNFGIKTVEIWNFQFDEESIEYCGRIKAAAEAVGSKINDLQLDLGPLDNLSDTDAAKRATTIATMKQWIDRSAACGATSMRANTGFGTEANWNVGRTADGFRELAEYGQGKGVMILVENHIGYSENIDKVVEILKTVNHPNCKAICDWGNTAMAGTIDEKVAALSKLFPYLHLVSAKQLDFDANNRHTSYDVVPIIKATEASGFKGVYSIEFYSETAPPNDPVAAAKTMIQTLAANITA
jgi:sugar phosphate isomerase/epimerase